MSAGEVLHIRGLTEGSCDVHAWPTEGLARRLVSAMRVAHPKGVNACRDCIARALDDAKAKRP